MSIRTSIILVVSLVMMAGYVFFVQLRGTVEVKDEPPWFYNVDMSDMARITITDYGDEAVFFYAPDGHWHMDDIDGLPVGHDRWGGVVLLLSGPKSRRMLDSQPTDLEPYGLDVPRIKIQLDLKDGRSIPVLLGLPTPDGVGYYGRVEGFPEVFTIASEWGQVMTSLVTEPPYPLWHYNVEVDAITKLAFRTQDKVVSMAYDDSVWRFDDYDKSLVDETKLPALWSSLKQPSQAVFDYDAGDLIPYGLDEPSISLFLQTKRLRDDNVTLISEWIFHIGNATEDETRYYVQTEREELYDDVFTVDADWVEGLQAVFADSAYPNITDLGN